MPKGARRIGWADRAREPRARREGGKLIGLGMASAIMSTFRFACSARVALGANGSVTVEAGTQEIGTGTRTILAQVAADRLGIPVERVNVELGSTALPQTGGTFGSSTTISVGSAVAAAADELQAKLRGLAGSEAAPPPDDWPELLIAKGVSRLEAEGGFQLPGGAAFDAHGGAGEHSMHTFGAVFVEMEVDEELGLARMRRAVGCYSAGRILNPVSARSQMIGGIIWGYGRAMLEASAMDPRYGRYLSKNLSGVLLPVNADIPRDIDVCFIEEHDPHASAIGVRGIGELGEVGVAAAAIRPGSLRMSDDISADFTCLGVQVGMTWSSSAAAPEDVRRGEARARRDRVPVARVSAGRVDGMMSRPARSRPASARGRTASGHRPRGSSGTPPTSVWTSTRSRVNRTWPWPPAPAIARAQTRAPSELGVRSALGRDHREARVASAIFGERRSSRSRRQPGRARPSQIWAASPAHERDGAVQRNSRRRCGVPQSSLLTPAKEPTSRSRWLLFAPRRRHAARRRVGIRPNKTGGETTTMEDSYTWEMRGRAA